MRLFPSLISFLSLSSISHSLTMMSVKLLWLTLTKDLHNLHIWMSSHLGSFQLPFFAFDSHPWYSCLSLLNPRFQDVLPCLGCHLSHTYILLVPAKAPITYRLVSWQHLLSPFGLLYSFLLFSFLLWIFLMTYL